MCGAELRGVVVDRSVSSEQELHVGKGVTVLAEKDDWREESPLDSGQGSYKSDGIDTDQVTNSGDDNGKTVCFFFCCFRGSPFMKS